MKVKMLQTKRGTEDGFTVQQYLEGSTYDLTDQLAKNFLATGVAERTNESITRLGGIPKHHWGGRRSN